MRFEPKYKSTVTADEIIKDGWSEGLQVGQTLEELKIMGFSTSKSTIIKAWVKLDEDLKAWMDSMTKNNP